MSEPLVIWRLTDGKPGHMQQTLGLVRALSALTPCEVIDMDLAAQPVGWRDFLLGRFMPGVAKKRPQLIIGAGHATHFGVLAARKAVGGKAVALMKPSLPAFMFDFVIAPEHDGMRESARVINTLGVLNPMRAGEKKPDSMLFLIGGPSKHVSWDNTAILQQVEAVVASLKQGSAWRITDSRRTPDNLRAVLQQKYGERFQSFAQCPPGWLAERLPHTETVWVTEDSVSMVYEALTAACHVGLLRLPEADRNSRVMRGVEKLIGDGVVTAFADWSRVGGLRQAEGFNEAARAAALLYSRM
ncbi:MAG: mitochondrial fission ELM1 family protein [Moraxellaceae bacterium]